MTFRIVSPLLLPALLAAQTPIYISGPTVTHPGGGANGGHLSALQVLSVSPLAMNQIGYGAWRNNLLSTLHLSVADAFATNGVWSVSQIELYCYQTGVTAPSISGFYVEIYDGDPANGGQPIAGSPGLANNLFTTLGYTMANAMVNVYRASLATPNDATRQLQSVRAILPTPLLLDSATLPGGVYWIEFQLESTLSTSGPFVSPLTVMGAPSTGVAIQGVYTNGVPTYQLLQDVGFPPHPVPYRAGVPFRLYGTAAAPSGVFTNLGGGCSNAGLDVRGAPHIGGIVFAELTNLSPVALPMVLAGFSDPNASLGICSCIQHAAADILYAPTTSVTWNIPLDPTLVGGIVYFQGGQLDFFAATSPLLPCDTGVGLRFDLTNAVKVQLY